MSTATAIDMASSYWPSNDETTADANNNKMRGSLSCSKNFAQAVSSSVLASSFGPEIWRLRSTSCAARPSSAWAPSRSRASFGPQVTMARVAARSNWSICLEGAGASRTPRCWAVYATPCDECLRSRWSTASCRRRGCLKAGGCRGCVEQPRSDELLGRASRGYCRVVRGYRRIAKLPSCVSL